MNLICERKFFPSPIKLQKKKSRRYNKQAPRNAILTLTGSEIHLFILYPYPDLAFLLYAIISGWCLKKYCYLRTVFLHKSQCFLLLNYNNVR